MRIGAIVGIVTVSLVACSSSTPERAASPTPSPISSPSGSPSPMSPAPEPTEEPLPNLPVGDGRVEGKYRGFGLYDDTIVFVPRCNKGGRCDVVGNSRKGTAKFEYANGGYRAEYTVDEECASGGYSTDVDVRIQFKFKIASSDYDRDGVWRAEKLKVLQRVNSPGLSRRFTTSTHIITLTCDPYTQKDRGTMTRLASRV